MPWKLVKRGSQVCVVKRDTGETVHCHGTRGQALAQMRALYASENKEFNEDEIVIEEEEIKEVWTAASVNDLPDSAFLYIEDGGSKDSEGKTVPRSLRHLPVKNSSGSYDAAHVRNAIARIPQMKGISGAKKAQLQARARRILASLNKSVKDRVIDAVKSVFETSEHTDDFVVYKDVESGQWMWRGTYSNIYRDRDNPPEILSEKAHQTFEYMLDKEIVPMPELWLWHIKSATVGVAHDVWYEDGEAKAEGTFYPGSEPVAESLSKMKELGMSHGMPKQFIIRNAEDPSIIDGYISKELTVLPKSKAANLLTEFSVIKEDVMNKPITEEQKEFLKGAGFDDAKITQISELQNKEATPELELKQEEVEAEEVVVEEEKAKKKPVVETACNDEEMDETYENSKKPKKGCKKELDPETVVSKEDFEAVGKATADAISALSTQIQSIAEQFKSLSENFKSLKESEEERVVKAAEGTPAMSMAELIRNSVIGKETARIDGRTELAKDKPKEAPTAEQQQLPVGLGWMNDIAAGKNIRDIIKQ